MKCAPQRQGKTGKPAFLAEVSALKRSVLAALDAARTVRSGGSLEALYLADRCEKFLSYGLIHRKDAQWTLNALVHLAGAAEWLKRYALEPEIFGDVASLVEAAWLLGKAEAVAGEARLVNQFKKGRPPGRDAAAQRIREALTSNPTGSNNDIADSAFASTEYVREVRGRRG